jgi:hypothetical protein
MSNEQPVLKNVAVLKDDHALLREMAQYQERSMTRALGVILRKAYTEYKEEAKV